MTCKECGGRMELPPISIRTALFALRKIGAVDEAGFKKLDREWGKHRKANGLDAYGNRFKQSERNRRTISVGDRVLFREYGTGFWGTCEIAGDWEPDTQTFDKHGTEAGWFPISEIERWDAVLPFEVIRSELSNQDHRSRIIRLEEKDWDVVHLASKIYRNLGYGSTDGDFFVLESGLEEAVKANLSQISLVLAEDDIQQQCNMGLGVGRSDLICRDKNGNFVVLELKAGHSSDSVVGQILRYIGYVRENWAKTEGKDVSGIILTPSFDEQLRLAAAEANIKVLRVRIQ
ncbi:MAG: endonuclease NucS [Desulfatiglandaceae bacterium]